MGQPIYGEDGRFLGEVLCWEDGLSCGLFEGEDLGPCDPIDEFDADAAAMAAFAALDDFEHFLPADLVAPEDVAWWSEWSNREDAA